MSSMLHDISYTGATVVNIDALKSEVRKALINQKVNACPMAMRMAWHASGTYDSKDKSGGSNGATMRFPPESTDGANAGLNIIRDL
jgi:catalase (peroxidase I)